jgi:hypothetical protein
VLLRNSIPKCLVMIFGIDLKVYLDAVIILNDLWRVDGHVGEGSELNLSAMLKQASLQDQVRERNP